MGDFTQFLWAMWDSTQAALIGLNPVPVVIFGLFFGMIQSRRMPAWILAIIAVIPAVIVTALLPRAIGYQAIWPDVLQLEVQIQIAMLLLIAYVTIRIMGLIKLTLSLIGPKADSHKAV